MEFNNTVAVVTGGADGIGLASAQRLRSLGAQVVIADVDEIKVEQQANTHGFVGVVCDVSDEDDISNLAKIANELGEVSFVMANAGVAVGGRFEHVPIDEWQRLFEVNVHGVVRTVNAFLPDMLERERGRLVVTGSSAGLFVSDGFNVPYAASKHALLALSQGLMSYCQASNVQVHYLAPRITDTAFPRTSIAWGRRGSRVTHDRELGSDFDTVDDVVDAFFHGMANDDFLISLTPDTKERMQSELSVLLE
ncbi:MAG: SDR family oxidoreductase [Pseudomonadota bacterium]